MKPNWHETALQKYNDALGTTSTTDSSRYIACVSAAGAIVWGVFFAVMAGPPSNGAMPLVLFVIVHHIGQAVTSAISFKSGAAFALIALIGQVWISITILIVNTEIALCLAFLTTPVICSVCAVILARRHSAERNHADDG